MAEAPEPEQAGAEPEVQRVDLFKDIRPYYGPIVQLEIRENVPTLFTMSMRCVIDKEIPFEGMPTVLNSKLAHYKQHQEYSGPKVFKCSVCSKFYSKHKKFLEHTCE